MKKTLLIVLPLLLIIGCTQKPVDEGLLIEKDGLFYEKDSNKPYSGTVYGKPLMPNIFEEDNFKVVYNGKEVERWIYEGEYVNGVLVGEYTFYNLIPSPPSKTEFRSLKKPMMDDRSGLRKINGKYYAIYGENYKRALNGEEFEPYTGSAMITAYGEGVPAAKFIYRYGNLTEHIFYNNDAVRDRKDLGFDPIYGSIREPINVEELEFKDGRALTPSLYNPSKGSSDEYYYGEVFGLYPSGELFFNGVYIGGSLVSDWLFEPGEYTYYKKDGSIQEPIKEDILVDKDGIKNIPLFGLMSEGKKFLQGTKEPYGGIVYGQYPNGDKMYDGLYKDGVLVGDYTWYGYGDTPDWQVRSFNRGLKEKDNLWYNGDMVFSGITGEGTYYNGIKHGKWKNGSYLFGEKHGKFYYRKRDYSSGYEVEYTNGIPSTSITFEGNTGQGITLKYFEETIKLTNVDTRDVIENINGMNGIFTDKVSGEKITGSFFIQWPKNRNEEDSPEWQYNFGRAPSIFLTIKDGKLNGEFCMWTDTRVNQRKGPRGYAIHSRVEMKGLYRDGIGDGLWVKYYASNRKDAFYKWYEITLKGVNDGNVYQIPYPHWKDQGYGMVEEGVSSFYTLGRPDKSYAVFNNKGILLIEGNYKDGVETGTWKGYHTSNNQLWWEAYYEGGNLNTENYIHFPTKNKMTLGGMYLGSIKPLLVHGNPSGIWIEWDKYGNKELEVDCNNKNFIFYSNGQKTSEVIMKEGDLRGFRSYIKEALTTEYHSNGQVSAKGAGRSGGQTDTWTYWYPNGEIIGKGTWKSFYKDENDPKSFIGSMPWDGTFVVDHWKAEPDGLVFEYETGTKIIKYKAGEEISRKSYY